METLIYAFVGSSLAFFGWGWFTLKCINSFGRAIIDTIISYDVKIKEKLNGQPV